MSTPSSAALTELVSSNSSSLYVPPELLKEIFGHCDAPTLAAVSRVSSACLELTAKLLYTDITLDDTESIALLLRLELNNKISDTHISRSDRVSACTSLSIVHSVTLHDTGVADVYALDERYKVLGPSPQPLTIEVLAISVATAAIDDSGNSDLPTVNIHQIATLFSPRIFVLLGRRAPLPTPLPDITRLVEVRSHNSTYWPVLPWPDLAFCIQSGAGLVLGDFRMFHSRPIEDDVTHPPARLIWDMLDIRADPKNEVIQTCSASMLFVYYAIAEYPGVEALGPRLHRGQGWVAAQGIKDNLLTRWHAGFGDFGTDVPPVVDVPSNRVRRLRDAIVELGARKDMDWAALDDI